MFTSCDNASSSKSSPAIGPGSNQVTMIETPRLLTRPSTNKTVIVGLYGVSGCGKTFLLNQLKQELGHEHHAFFEGSEIIASLVDGNLNSFHKMPENEKVSVRKKAIDWVREKYTGSGMVVVITGHFMFWTEGEEAGSFVYTQNDLDTFTHMLYLNVPVRVIAQYRLKDIERDRAFMSISHLSKWQLEETTQLRSLCRDNGILFSLVSQHSTMLEKVLMLLHDFQHHSEEVNLSMVMKRLDDVFKADPRQLDTVLVMDADRTLTAEDTGALFWQKASGSQMPKDEDCQLKTLFKSPLGYSYTAFRQAALLYQEKANDQEFDNICKDVASAVTMHPEFVSLLQLVAEQEHIGAIVVSCGLQRIWDQVLEKEGLSTSVKVIGGGRINEGFIITAAVKAALVSRLQTLHLKYVWAFGDSPLDLDMLSTANRPIIVVGEEGKRSRTMDAALMDAIDNQGLQACQVLLPSNATPRLDTTKLPLVQLTDQDFIDSVLCPRGLRAGAQVIHATHRKTAKLLMTPMRDATIAGPVLREAHRRVGWYLATEFLPDIIGVEEYSISHVQGHRISGYRLFHEQQTLIVGLMRGGEPMALGVNDAFPLAMFIHASRPEDIMPHHLQGQLTMVLVDSVVNSGKTVIQFVRHVRSLNATIHIVVVTGVAQAHSISEGNLARTLARNPKLMIVALRLSDNKFTGKGTTDTGNRLFNTTHLL